MSDRHRYSAGADVGGAGLDLEGLSTVEGVVRPQQQADADVSGSAHVVFRTHDRATIMIALEVTFVPIFARTSKRGAP